VSRTGLAVAANPEQAHRRTAFMPRVRPGVRPDLVIALGEHNLAGADSPAKGARCAADKTEPVLAR
jgi:hypothetical protein